MNKQERINTIYRYQQRWLFWRMGLAGLTGMFVFLALQSDGASKYIRHRTRASLRQKVDECGTSQAHHRLAICIGNGTPRLVGDSLPIHRPD